MRVLLVEPRQEPKVVEIGEELQDLQTVVSGTIQVVFPFAEEVALVCNDEGKLLGLPLNRGLRGADGTVYDVVAGTFFLCAAPGDSEHFASLTEEQLSRYSQWFAKPEQFIFVNGEVLALPLEVTHD